MKTYKTVTYWKTFTDALNYALANDLPTDRIIKYQKGYAIQRYVSGPYYNEKAKKWC